MEKQIMRESLAQDESLRLQLEGDSHLRDPLDYNGNSLLIFEAVMGLKQRDKKIDAFISLG